MNNFYFSAIAVLLGCIAHSQRDVSHEGKCRVVLSSDEVRVICLHANFTRLPGKVFPSNTTYLKVSGSNLSSIAPEDLKIFSHLRDLILTSNQLQTLPADLLKGLTNLCVLDLTGNKLTTLPSRVFHHSPLVELTLSGNLLSKMDAETLPVNSSVQRLDLSSNRFTQLPVDFLRRLANLQSLDLQNNQLEVLSGVSLVSLDKLEALYLENNQLKSIDPSAFSGNPNLQQIFLGNNLLKSLPDRLFLQQNELLFLDLRNNSLQNLTPGTLDGRLSVVLSGNPWHCDSSLVYLWHWMRMNEKRIFHDDKITCQTPEHLRGRNITGLAASELGISEGILINVH